MNNDIGIGDVILEKNMIAFVTIQSNPNPSSLSHGLGPGPNPDGELLRDQSSLNAFLIHEEGGLDHEFAPRSSVHDNSPDVLNEWDGLSLAITLIYTYQMFLPLSMGEVPMTPDHPSSILQNPSEFGRRIYLTTLPDKKFQEISSQSIWSWSSTRLERAQGFH